MLWSKQGDTFQSDPTNWALNINNLQNSYFLTLQVTLTYNLATCVVFCYNVNLDHQSTWLATISNILKSAPQSHRKVNSAC